MAEHQPRKLILDPKSPHTVRSRVRSSQVPTDLLFAFFLHLYHPTVLSRQKPARTGPAEGQSGLLRCIWFVDAGTGLASPQDFPTRRGVKKPSTLAPGGSGRRTADAPLTRKAHHDAATRASQSSALGRRAAGGLASPQRSHSARPGPSYLGTRTGPARRVTAKSTVTPGTGLASPQPSGDARTTC